MITEKLFEEEDKLLQQQIDEANQNIQEEEITDGTVKQGSKEWFKLRLGKFTGSPAPNLMKGGTGKDKPWGELAYKVVRKVYMERDLTDEGIDMYVEEMFNKEFYQTKWGKKYEPIARELYCEKTGDQVEETGFAVHEKFDFIGGSFDGKVIGKKKILEIKCPFDMLIHDDNCVMLETGMPSTHKDYAQVQLNIEIAGADSCDFVSYDPRRKNNKLIIINVERDEEYLTRLMRRIFVAENAIKYMNLGMTVEDAIVLSESDFANN